MGSAAVFPRLPSCSGLGEKSSGVFCLHRGPRMQGGAQAPPPWATEGQDWQWGRGCIVAQSRIGPPAGSRLTGSVFQAVAPPNQERELSRTSWSGGGEEQAFLYKDGYFRNRTNKCRHVPGDQEPSLSPRVEAGGGGCPWEVFSPSFVTVASLHRENAGHCCRLVLRGKDTM